MQSGCLPKRACTRAQPLIHTIHFHTAALPPCPTPPTGSDVPGGGPAARAAPAAALLRSARRRAQAALRQPAVRGVCTAMYPGRGTGFLCRMGHGGQGYVMPLAVAGLPQMQCCTRVQLLSTSVPLSAPPLSAPPLHRTTHPVQAGHPEHLRTPAPPHAHLAGQSGCVAGRGRAGVWICALSAAASSGRGRYPAQSLGLDIEVLGSPTCAARI